jgi:hypothetical protein
MQQKDGIGNQFDYYIKPNFAYFYRLDGKTEH